MAIGYRKTVEQPFAESNDNAILRMKFATKIIGMETIPFEELVNREDCFIRIDFPDGHSLMEHEFKMMNVPEEKLFVEFFDTYQRKNLIPYFSRDESDYRVTDSNGTVLRLAHADIKRVAPVVEKKQKKKVSKQVIGNELHAFYGDIQLIQKTLLKIINKKDK